MPFIAGALAGLFTWFMIILVGNMSEFNDWQNACYALNGQTLQTDAGFWTDRWECFVDGEQITVPGYEGE